MFPSLAASIDEKKRQRNQNGGTRNATNFRSKTQRNNPNITNHYFNGQGDGAAHGHVKEQRNPDGSVSYPYARDVEGREFIPKK